MADSFDELAASYRQLSESTQHLAQLFDDALASGDTRRFVDARVSDDLHQQVALVGVHLGELRRQLLLHRVDGQRTADGQAAQADAERAGGAPAKRPKSPEKRSPDRRTRQRRSQK